MNTHELNTRLGRLRGLEQDGVRSYLGLRYAEPPMRFHPPVQSGAWQGTLDATRYGPQPVQPPPHPGSQLMADLVDEGGYSEDCLRLNIHCPDSPSPSPRPVLVWIYGGAFREGSANQYDGSLLAKGADAVVVAINYRLGIFGCMDLRPLGAGYERCVNVWLADQITALRWVRDNIADYGGDPGCVTIFGQSAGGTSVTALCASSEAQGLFHRAIANSPAFMWPENSNYLPGMAAKLKLSPAQAHAYLSSATPEKLLQLGGENFYPFIDGDVVRAKPEHAMQSASQVPLMAGFAAHDGQFLEHLYRARGMWFWRRRLQLGLIAKYIATLVAGSAADRKTYLKRLFAWKKPSNGSELSDLVWTDVHRRASMIHCEAVTKAGGRAWHYRFDVPCVFGRKTVPATHCVDIPFMFNWLAGNRHGLWVARNPDNVRLGAAWLDAISRFVRTGSLEGSALGEWPEYGTQRRSRIVDAASARIIDDLDGEYRSSIWPRAG